MKMRNLQTWMSCKGVTQADLACMLDVTQGAVSHWLNGTNCPRASALVGLSRLTGMTLDQLMDQADYRASPDPSDVQ